MMLTIRTVVAGSAIVMACVLLAGCSILGGSKEPVTVYAPDPRVAPEASWPHVTWQLEIARPDAARTLDSLRIAVRPRPDELQVYKGVSWA